MNAFRAVVVALAMSLSVVAEVTDFEVRMHGTLACGVSALGGETTGYTVTTKSGIKLELSFADAKKLEKVAKGLDGKRVRVEGRLELRNGVETGTRRIIRVEKIEEVKT